MSKREYIGARYVPLICGEYDAGTAYEPLSVVLWQGNSYTSLQSVPEGITPQDGRYWVLSGNYSAEAARLDKRIDNIIAPSPDPTIAELVDVRLGADGVLYDGAGVAVRANDDRLQAQIDKKAQLVQLYCDGNHIYDKRGGTQLNFNQVQALIAEPTNYVSINVNDTYTAKSAAHFGDAIEFIGYGIIDGLMWMNRVIINEQNQVKEEELNPAEIGDVERVKNMVLPLITEVPKKLDADTSRNIFNINAENKKESVYINYATGRIASNPSFTSIVVPVVGGSTISCNIGNTHVSAYSAIPDLPSMAVGETVSGYISGFADSQPKQGWVVPNNAVCLIVSTSQPTRMQIEYGNVSTPYAPYQRGLKLNRVLDLNIAIVGLGQQYETIQDAVDNVADNATIYVMPGIYDEAVDVRSTEKFLKIVGLSRDECILTHSSGDYYYPPLEIGEGVVENMTIRATGTTLAEGATQLAYCVHIDYNQSIDSSLQFINCVFENDVRNCVGIGLRRNFTLNFTDCVFIGHQTDGVVYCHEQQDNNITGQRLELIDCSIYADNTAAVCPIRLQETTSLTGNDATLLIQRCIVKARNGFPEPGKVVYIYDYLNRREMSGGAKWRGSNTWSLATMSALNNENMLNA